MGRFVVHLSHNGTALWLIILAIVLGNTAYQAGNIGGGDFILKEADNLAAQNKFDEA